MRHWIAAAALLVAASAASAQVSLWVHGLSKHTEGDFNEVHPGLGLRYDLTPSWSVQAGFYKNSVNRATFYALAQWQPVPLSSNTRAGVFVGYASGYNTRYPLTAGFMLTTELHRNVALGARLVPEIRNVTPTVIAVDIAWRFQ